MFDVCPGTFINHFFFFLFVLVWATHAHLALSYLRFEDARELMGRPGDEKPSRKRSK